MSCIMSSPELLAALARTITYIGNGRYDTIGFDLPRTLELELANCRDVGGSLLEDHIYGRLYRLNAAAYNSRYKEHQADIVAPDKPDGKRLLPVCVSYSGEWDGHFVVKPAHYDLARTLDLYLYQCDEAPTNKDGLYLALNELAYTVHKFIVRNSEHYQSAKWGKV